MRIAAMLAGVVVGGGGIAFAPAAGADPMGTNCETNFWGALYCDGPVRPDGSWTRCVTDQPSTTWIGGDNPPITTPGYHKCWVYNPADPATFNFSPDHHIGDGL